MNKIFKVIFNHTTQTWAAVSELAKGYCKSSSNNTIEVLDGRKESASSFSGIKTIAITSAMMMTVVPNAFAVTAGGEAIKWTTGQGTAIAGGEANGDSNSIAIGRANDKVTSDHQAKALAPGAIAIGTKSNVGNGANSGVALGYDTSVTGGIRSAAIGSGSRANGETSTAVGGYANANGKGAAALGANTTASGEGATAVGFNSTAGAGATAIGRNSNAGSGGIAIGENSQAASPDSIVIGRGTTIKDAAHDGTVIIGANISNGGSVNSVVIGKQANTGNLESVALGYGANTHSQKATALGSNAKVNANSMHAIALGSGSEAGSVNTVTDLKFKTDNGTETTAAIAAKDANSVLSIGNNNHKRQIVNVAAGRVSQDSTDAVNGSQLYAVMKNSGFNIQQNGTPKSRINNDGLVNFTDGNYTTAEVTDGNNSSSVKVNVVTQDITTDAKGVTSVSGNSAGLTTAKTVSDAINNALNRSGFSLKANGENGDGEKITRNGSINIAQGKNINVERNGSTITVKTVDSPNFTNVAASGSLTVSGTSNLRGDVLLGGEGKNVTFQGGSTVDMGNNKITNVANGTEKTDAVNKGQLDDVSTVANAANATANNANTTANAAKDTADNANTTANAAKDTADNANTTANAAKDTADNANATANSANETANTANSTANAANETANNANSTANSANTTANNALNKVNQGWNINTGKTEGGNVEGNDSTNVQMGDTVNVIAGKNINITQSGQNITLAVNDSPSFTNVTTTNLTATNGTITNLNSTNGTITNLNSTNGTITNLNSTNGTITNLNSTNGTITNLNSTNGTITNLNSTNGTITNLNSTNGTITNLNSTNGTITNLNSTNGTITNLNSTNGTITNLNSTNGTITNLNSTNGTITNLNSTNGTIT
ncbi:ESPR-type extended signal peptide-containing protein, partial [Rodentibacter ratti]|uniref:ESPR-type extended signal peptide-containing protein n=1 Tax=Rodentibacter ratti TaxID=1906745 RepID=UPI00117AD924